MNKFIISFLLSRWFKEHRIFINHEIGAMAYRALLETYFGCFFAPQLTLHVYFHAFGLLYTDTF